MLVGPHQQRREHHEGAEERDTILDLFFEYCRQYFDYTALLIVQGDLAEGWDAFGSGASRERIVEIGIPLDMPSMLASARDYIERAPWVVTLPGLAILGTVLAINLMGDGLRDALDPRLRQAS